MIRGIEIPLCDELVIKSEDIGRLPEWAIKLKEQVREEVEEYIKSLDKSENVHVGIQIFLYLLPPEKARIALERSIKQGIEEVMKKYNKEIDSLHCSYNFFNRVKRVSIEIF